MAKPLSDMLVTYIIGGVLIFGIIAFAMSVQNDNNANENINSSGSWIGQKYTNLSDTLSDIDTSTKGTKDSVYSETPTTTVTGLSLTSIWTAGKVYSTFIFGISSLLQSGLAYIGVSSIVYLALGALIIALVILAVWSVLKLGGYV